MHDLNTIKRMNKVAHRKAMERRKQELRDLEAELHKSKSSGKTRKAGS